MGSTKFTYHYSRLNARSGKSMLSRSRKKQQQQTRNRATLVGCERSHHPTIHVLTNCNSYHSEPTVLITSYHQNTIKIIKMIITTPTTTPITAHFQTLLLGSTVPAVGDVVGVADLKRTSTSEMFAPIAVSSADL